MAKKLNITTMESPVRYSREEIEKCVRCRVLIVCEGEKTEPAYFKSFHMMKNSASVVFDITNEGGRISTMQVVDQAIALRNKAIDEGKPYDTVWAVFDKDDFEAQDFDNAINKSESNQISCGWSNEAFELWYLYHFYNRTTEMSREEYKKELTNCIRNRSNNKQYTYKKNDPGIRETLRLSGCNEKEAIRLAKQQSETFSGRAYHKHNPCTMVYKLVRLLRGEDEEFNRKIKRKLQ